MNTLSLPVPRAAMIALALEVLMALALVYLLTSREERATPIPVTEIMLAPPVPATPQPTTPTPPNPQKPPPAPTPVSRPSNPPVHRELARAMPLPMPAVSNDPAPDVVSPQPAPQETPPPAAQPARPVASTIFPARFGDMVRAAVQSAVVFPMAARASHLSGRTQVAFYYQDGTITEVKITTSSGNALLDKAAVAAVNAARYPPPPQEYQGKLLSFEIWVRFLRLEEQAE